MRLFEAILEANQRRVRGDRDATIPAAEFAAALPVAALTCIDARLNRLLPDMLGLPAEQFIWLRNAGNIITGPLSSTMRSLALACAVKGGKEVAVIGHTDCLVGKTTMLQLLEKLGSLGVDRQRLPENLVEYFGLFGSERQNVIRGVELVRSSPLIGIKVPVHGLLMDLPTGRLEWVVNGYQASETVTAGKTSEWIAKTGQTLDRLAAIGAAAEEMKLPTGKIGDIVSTAHDWLHKAETVAAAAAPKIEAAVAAVAHESKPPAAPAPAEPPRIASDPLAMLQEQMRRYTAAKRNQRQQRKP